MVVNIAYIFALTSVCILHILMQVGAWLSFSIMTQCLPGK